MQSKFSTFVGFPIDINHILLDLCYKILSGPGN